MKRRILFKKSILALMVILFQVCCSSGIMDELERPNEDPAFEKPIVRSFEVENTILVSWSDDECADEYILERSFDMAVPTYSVVYRGKKIFYQDAGLIDADCYLYRLIKIRGDTVYPPSLPVYGVSSSLIKDEFEDNNTKEKATLLLSDRISNMYYFISHDGQQVYDVDWYYVELGPKRKAQITINEQIAPAGNATHYKVTSNGTTNNVTNSTVFEVNNTEDVTRRISFAIEPHKAVFLGSVEQTGGGIVSYTIKLISVIKYE
ncbi:MAG TPA: hypothetical protein GXZ47_10560 [Treponema sp.]|nr:hypothetical protein [Treponema sp.]